MDLLGSILNSMDKPPAVNDTEKHVVKKRKLQFEQIKIKEREEIARFRSFVEERFGRFSQDDRKLIEFQPLDKIYRNIIHDVADIAGLVAMSFGQGANRHTVVYKKEHVPSDDEIIARRSGDEWNEEVAKEYANKREHLKILEAEQAKPPELIVPNHNYKEKYSHLIGIDAALKAAHKTESNKHYGFVPSDNKKDIRSIEQTMADIRAKKRLKIENKSTDENQT